MRIGYCAITADILHIGHINYLNACKKQCDYLIVGVMSDECVKKYKGQYPIMSLEDRMKVVGSLKVVDKVVMQNIFQFPIHDLVSDYRVDVIFDSKEHWREGADFYLDYTEGISSSQIKNKILKEWKKS